MGAFSVSTEPFDTTLDPRSLRGLLCCLTSTRYSGLILNVPRPRPGLCHFFRNPWFLLAGIGISKPHSRHKVFSLLLWSLLLGLFSGQSGNIHILLKIHYFMSSSWHFHSKVGTVGFKQTPQAPDDDIGTTTARLYFQSGFWFTAKLRRRQREFPLASCARPSWRPHLRPEWSVRYGCWTSINRS